METKEIIQALKHCHNLDECEDCEYNELGGFCEELLKRDAAKRLEVLSADLCHLREVISVLKKQLSQQQPEWISVEDRLPKSEFVLCTDGEYVFVDIIPDIEDAIEDGVTHWMPLPEPPKPKEPTFKDVFLEKFPNGLIELIQEKTCVNYFFRQFDAGILKCEDCDACWNLPYFEEEGEE